MTTFFSADTHFGHANIISHCARPFASVKDMDEAMVTRWSFFAPFAAGAIHAACPARGPLASRAERRERHSREKLVHDYGKVADALAGRMVDGVGDRRRSPDDAEFADALHPQRIDLGIHLGDHDHVHLGDIRIHGHEVFAEAVIDVATPLLVDLRGLEQRDDMPQIIPPMSWLRAVRGFTMRPAAKAPVMRGTRISRVKRWMRTSTNSAPNANIRGFPFLDSSPRAWFANGT